MSGRYLVVELDRHGRETGDRVALSTREEAEDEQYLRARHARLRWPDLVFQYEIRDEADL